MIWKLNELGENKKFIWEQLLAPCRKKTLSTFMGTPYFEVVMSMLVLQQRAQRVQ